MEINKKEKKGNGIINKNNKRKTWAIGIISIVVFSGIYAGVYYTFFQDTEIKREYDEIDLTDFENTVTHGKTYILNMGDGFSHLVMDLNGTYTEMGEAHAQLVGKYIKYSISYNIRAVFRDGFTNYNLLRNPDENSYLYSYINRNATYHNEEIHAIYQTCIDNEYDMYVPALERDWDELDLWLLNTIQDINQIIEQDWCSAFGIWDTVTHDGETLIARTLDFPTDPEAYITQLNLITIYRKNATRAHDVVTFSFPGLITSATGFNDGGVFLSTDNSNGIKTDSAGRTPMGIVMRNFLEIQSSTETINQEAIDYFTNASPFMPFLFLLGSNKTGENPVVVLEGNDAEVINRTGSDEGYSNYVFLTNHQRILEEPNQCSRYQGYLTEFSNLTSTGDKKIDIDETIATIQKGGGGSSLHCIIFNPDTLEFRFGHNQITNAINGSIYLTSQIMPAGKSEKLQYPILFEELI